MKILNSMRKMFFIFVHIAILNKIIALSMFVFIKLAKNAFQQKNISSNL